MKMLFAFVFLPLLASGQPVDDDAIGRTAYSRGQFRDAKVSFEKAVRRLEGRPLEQAITLTNLGQTLVALEEWTSAEKVLRKAVHAKPDSAQTWQYLGQVILRSNDPVEAEEHFRKALSLAASEPQLEASCLNDLAEVLKLKNRKPEALEMLDRAITLSQRGQARARILKNLGALHWELGSKRASEAALAEALREMETAVGSEHPDVAVILEDYALVLARSGKKAQSRESSLRAKELRNSFGWQANTTKGVVDLRELRATR